MYDKEFTLNWQILGTAWNMGKKKTDGIELMKESNSVEKTEIKEITTVRQN